MQHASTSLIDNIFIVYSRIDNYSTFPYYSGISDHDSQLVTIYNINNMQSISNLCVIRKINPTSLMDFNFELSSELRETFLRALI
jgi:hypothetical protein